MLGLSVNLNEKRIVLLFVLLDISNENTYWQCVSVMDVPVDSSVHEFNF